MGNSTGMEMNLHRVLNQYFKYLLTPGKHCLTSVNDDDVQYSHLVNVDKK